MNQLSLIILLGLIASFGEAQVVLPVVQKTLVASNRVNLANSGSAFGLSMTTSPSVLVVGASYEPSCDKFLSDNASCPFSGAAYVFLRDSAQQWTQFQYLKPSSPRPGGFFGRIIAVSADGGTIAIGAPKHHANSSGVVNGPTAMSIAQMSGDVPNRGAVFVFRRNGGTDFILEAFIQAEATQYWRGYDFGASLSLSADGRILAVTAAQYPSEEGGTDGGVNVYSYDGSTWAFRRVVQRAGISGFGFFVGLSPDGTLLAAQNLPPPGVDSTVAVFDISGFSQVELNIFSAGSTSNSNTFGKVLVTSGGQIFVLTDYGVDIADNSTGSWNRTQSLAPRGFGFSQFPLPDVAVSGDFLVLGFAPVMYVFRKQQVGAISSFSQVQEFSSPEAGKDDMFGRHVGFGVDSVFVAAHRADYTTGDEGLGRVYQYPMTSTSFPGLTFPPGSSVVQGDFKIVAGSVVFSQNAVLVVNGTLTLETQAAVVLISNVSGSSVFVTATTVVGQFASVRALNGNCPSVITAASVSAVSYSSSTISATISVSDCNGGSLSTEAMVGIIVGAAVGGILLAVALFLLFRLWRKKSDKNSRAILAKAESDGTRRDYQLQTI